jgi:hypothetical protein
MPCEKMIRGPLPWSLAAVCLLAGCHARTSEPTAAATGLATAATATATPPASAGKTAPAPGCLPTGDGYLRARLRGARDLDIDWQDAQLQCDGGTRPEGRGIRMAFAGHVGTQPLRFVFGIDVQPGGPNAKKLPARKNLPTNVTLIFEGQNAIYSTQGDGRCTVDELSWDSHEPNAPARVVARGFCVAPASAVGNGPGILVSRFDFAGRLPEHD